MKDKEHQNFRDPDLPKERSLNSFHHLEGISEVLQQYRVTVSPWREQILFVEGDHQYRDLIRRVLVYRGYDVETVEDQGQAYAYCLKHQPRMVLIDIDLPKDAGWHLLQKIQQTCKTISAIAITAGDATIQQKARDIGFVDVLTKPFVPTQFLATIGKHWEKPKTTEN